VLSPVLHLTSPNINAAERTLIRRHSTAYFLSFKADLTLLEQMTSQSGDLDDLLAEFTLDEHGAFSPVVHIQIIRSEVRILAQAELASELRDILFDKFSSFFLLVPTILSAVAIAPRRNLWARHASIWITIGIIHARSTSRRYLSSRLAARSATRHTLKLGVEDFSLRRSEIRQVTLDAAGANVQVAGSDELH
jgi:hypothetical protein